MFRRRQLIPLMGLLTLLSAAELAYAQRGRGGGRPGGGMARPGGGGMARPGGGGMARPGGGGMTRPSMPQNRPAMARPSMPMNRPNMGNMAQNRPNMGNMARPNMPQNRPNPGNMQRPSTLSRQALVAVDLASAVTGPPHCRARSAAIDRGSAGVIGLARWQWTGRVEQAHTTSRSDRWQSTGAGWKPARTRWQPTHTASRPDRWQSTGAGRRQSARSGRKQARVRWQ